MHPFEDLSAKRVSTKIHQLIPGFPFFRLVNVTGNKSAIFRIKWVDVFWEWNLDGLGPRVSRIQTLVRTGRCKNLYKPYRGLKNTPPLKVQKASFQKGFRGVFFSKSEIQKCQGVLFLCRRLPNSPLKTLKIPKKNRASRESCRGVLFSKILRKWEGWFYGGGLFLSPR